MIEPIIIAPGEPAGIGPDVLLMTAAEGGIPYPHVVYADADMLAARAQRLGLSVTFRQYDYEDPNFAEPGVIDISDMPLDKPVVCGTPDPGNAFATLATIYNAQAMGSTDCYHGMVTGPVCKAVMAEYDKNFTGLTDFFSNFWEGEGEPVMCFVNSHIKVALVTRHLPLSDVPAAITPRRLKRVIEVCHTSLIDRFGIQKPRLLVTGLNPHAGEGGLLGEEEVYIIEPIIREFQKQGLDIIGPVPADTAFTPERLEGIDMVIAMYHDQALPVIKSQHFHETVNVTLGLPFLRTAPDHGTAFPLAGTGKADPRSFQAALHLAAKLKIKDKRPMLTCQAFMMGPDGKPIEITK